MALDREHSRDDHDSDGNDPTFQCGGCDAQPLYRSQYRDGWSDYAISVEQRRAEQSDSDEPAIRTSRATLSWRPYQCQESQNSTFPSVIGSHDHRQILQCYHEVEGPKNERQDAENIVFGNRHSVGTNKTLLQGVQRAGADVAVHDAERAQGEDGQPAAGG
jgi:hypothetical protein